MNALYPPQVNSQLLHLWYAPFPQRLLIIFLGLIPAWEKVNGAESDPANLGPDPCDSSPHNTIPIVPCVVIQLPRTRVLLGGTDNGA